MARIININLPVLSLCCQRFLFSPLFFSPNCIPTHHQNPGRDPAICWRDISYHTHVPLLRTRRFCSDKSFIPCLKQNNYPLCRALHAALCFEDLLNSQTRKGIPGTCVSRATSCQLASSAGLAFSQPSRSFSTLCVFYELVFLRLCYHHTMCQQHELQCWSLINIYI